MSSQAVLRRCPGGTRRLRPEMALPGLDRFCGFFRKGIQVVEPESTRARVRQVLPGAGRWPLQMKVLTGCAPHPRSRHAPAGPPGHRTAVTTTRWAIVRSEHQALRPDCPWSGLRESASGRSQLRRAAISPAVSRSPRGKTCAACRPAVLRFLLGSADFNRLIGMATSGRRNEGGASTRTDSSDTHRRAGFPPKSSRSSRLIGVGLAWRASIKQHHAESQVRTWRAL
jgi:hypothetical protein